MKDPVFFDDIAASARGEVNQHTLVWVGLFVAVALFALAVIAGAASNAFDLVKLGNKVLNAALVLGCGTLYNLFWLTRRFKTDERISRSAIATAIYAGCIWIALALAVTQAG